ncbi:hypothetical protein [Hydrocarboniclastica marina]|nr:hypothetical protein [Hydrocarboniclastica marina]|tara:strand:- start:1624 stop:1746 length:123 start_codon:yes stop_codon:yes gene_type:complete
MEILPADQAGSMPSMGAICQLAASNIAILRRSPFFPDPPY